MLAFGFSTTTPAAQRRGGLGGLSRFRLAFAAFAALAAFRGLLGGGLIGFLVGLVDLADFEPSGDIIVFLNSALLEARQ